MDMRVTQLAATIGTINFSTKAETLLKLSSIIKSAAILPLFHFTREAWKNQSAVLKQWRQLTWFQERLIVRSSGQGEDSEESSFAGCFTSIIDVNGEEAFCQAVEEVISSFNDDNQLHQILVQPLLADIAISGVIFTHDPNTGGPYHIINYDDQTGDSSSITGGRSNQQCVVHHHRSPHSLPASLTSLKPLIDELIYLFKTDYLDIEFAFTSQHKLYLFQVRPLLRQVMTTITPESHQYAIERIAQKIALAATPHPYLYGNRTIYGVMPDWNPAEIIGIRPKPLALSLYRELVTDAVWAYQRDNYGYANLRSFPLLVDFEGLPYIDVRVSFNSFLPKDLPCELAERLVNYYLSQLAEHPSLHDKVEFEIVFSCYTLDLKERLTALSAHQFTMDDQAVIADALITLTNRIINNQEGLWKKDLEKIHELERRQARLFESNIEPSAKMYWLLEDCKRYGTLPFAGLARAGFIAVQILKSFVNVGIISDDEYTNFLTSVNTVSSTMSMDFEQLEKSRFLAKYGHLRPGTYDVLSPSYQEAPDRYFDWDEKSHTSAEAHTPFALTIHQLRQIQAYIDRDQLEITVLELLEFIKTAIESREYAKFIFTRSVSRFLTDCTLLSEQYGISAEDCAYLNVKAITSLYSSTIDPMDALQKSIASGKKQHQMTSAISLPPLITDEMDAWTFAIPESSPNFITQKSATGHTAFADAEKEVLADAILFIPMADPGFDWIFSHKIAGFITQYGGVNSHMAIRAGELGIPAIIGAGEMRFNTWSQAKRLHIDCLNKQVQAL